MKTRSVYREGILGGVSRDNKPLKIEEVIKLLNTGASLEKALEEAVAQLRNSRCHVPQMIVDAIDALEELYAMVKGECPSLLNEDSGGDARLDMNCQKAIAAFKGKPGWDTNDC